MRLKGLGVALSQHYAYRGHNAAWVLGSFCFLCFLWLYCLSEEYKSYFIYIWLQAMNQDRHMTRQTSRKPWTPHTNLDWVIEGNKRTTIPFARFYGTTTPIKKQHPASSPTEQHLNLEDEIPVRRVDYNKPGFWRSQKYKLFKIFPAMCEACRC